MKWDGAEIATIYKLPGEAQEHESYLGFHRGLCRLSLSMTPDRQRKGHQHDQSRSNKYPEKKANSDLMIADALQTQWQTTPVRFHGGSRSTVCGEYITNLNRIKALQ